VKERSPVLSANQPLALSRKQLEHEFFFQVASSSLRNSTSTRAVAYVRGEIFARRLDFSRERDVPKQFGHYGQEPFRGAQARSRERAAGYQVRATDIADRGYARLAGTLDFLTLNRLDANVGIAANRPFSDRILQHVIDLNPKKAALIWPLARVVAAYKWLSQAPLARILMLTPRPAIPPASYIAAGQKPKGARVEHCWLVFESGHHGPPRLHWLHRDYDGRAR
jgi:hypothetical protein